MIRTFVNFFLTLLTTYVLSYGLHKITFSNIQEDDRTPQYTFLYAIYGLLHNAVSGSVSIVLNGEIDT
jgi:hypothetical protein